MSDDVVRLDKRQADARAVLFGPDWLAPGNEPGPPHFGFRHFGPKFERWARLWSDRLWWSSAPPPPVPPEDVEDFRRLEAELNALLAAAAPDTRRGESRAWVFGLLNNRNDPTPPPWEGQP